MVYNEHNEKSLIFNKYADIIVILQDHQQFATMGHFDMLTTHRLPLMLSHLEKKKFCCKNFFSLLKTCGTIVLIQFM